MTIKFNGGNMALLCNKCGAVCATGDRIPQFCFSDNACDYLAFCSDKCMQDYIEEIIGRSVIIKNT